MNNPFVTNGYAGAEYFCDRVRETEFLVSKFEKAGKHIDNGVVATLYERFNSTTSYMQKVMNYMFQITQQGETCTASMIDEGINYILDISSDTYDNLIFQMPEKQRNVFFAIAHERQTKAIAGGNFAKRHHLPSPSAVVSAVKGLLEKDFITVDKGVYSVYDYFFQLWLERDVL